MPLLPATIRRRRIDPVDVTGPQRATKERHVAVCPELFGFGPGIDTRAWPVLRRAIAPQVESTGHTEHMLRPHAG